MKAIVFGSTGFIGSHVVEQLKASGHDVTAAVRELSNASFLKNIGVKLVTINFSNKDSLAEAIEGQEVVFNCTADVEFNEEKDLQEQVEFKLAKLLLGGLCKTSCITVYPT